MIIVIKPEVLSDEKQSLTPEKCIITMQKVINIVRVMGKTLV